MDEIEKVWKEIKDDYPGSSEGKELWLFWAKNRWTKDEQNDTKYYTPIRWDPESEQIMFIASNPSKGEYKDKCNRDSLYRFLETLRKIKFAKRIPDKNQKVDGTQIFYEGCFVTDW